MPSHNNRLLAYILIVTWSTLVTSRASVKDSSPCDTVVAGRLQTTGTIDPLIDGRTEDAAGEGQELIIDDVAEKSQLYTEQIRERVKERLVVGLYIERGNMCL